MFLQRTGDRSDAVFLNGDYAFHSFQVDVTHDWKGLALTDCDVVVDVSSAFDTENQWPTPGAIAINSKGAELGVIVRDPHGFTDKAELALDIQVPNITPSLEVSFRRWAFRVQEGDVAQLLWIEALSDSGH